MSLATLVGQVLPWATVFHCLFWISRAASASLSKTYRELDEPEKSYWASSVVSNLHAVVICWFSVTALCETPSFMTTSDFLLSTEVSLLCSEIFLGYIVSDLVLVLWYNAKWPGMFANLMHHVSMVICWSQLTMGKYGQLFALSAVCEASTPFVNFRWFLGKLGMKESLLYFYNGLAMTFSFFVLRVVGLLWMGTRIVAQREGLAALPVQNSMILLLSYGVGMALQLFWFSKIVKGAMKTLGYGRKKPLAKGLISVAGQEDIPIDTVVIKQRPLPPDVQSSERGFYGSNLPWNNKNNK